MDGFRRRQVLDLVSVNADAPHLAGLFQHFDHPRADQVAFLEGAVEIERADDRTRRGLGKLHGRHRVVRDAIAGAHRVDDRNVHDAVDLDPDLVLGEAFLRRHIDRFLLQVVNEGDAVENRNESVEAWTECLAIMPQTLDDESGAGWYDPDRTDEPDDQKEKKDAPYGEVEQLPPADAVQV